LFGKRKGKGGRASRPTCASIGGLRRRVRSTGESAGGSGKKKPPPGKGHHLLGRVSSVRKNCIGRARPRTTVRPEGEKMGGAAQKEETG